MEEQAVILDSIDQFTAKVASWRGVASEYVRDALETAATELDGQGWDAEKSAARLRILAGKVAEPPRVRVRYNGPPEPDRAKLEALRLKMNETIKRQMRLKFSSPGPELTGWWARGLRHKRAEFGGDQETVLFGGEEFEGVHFDVLEIATPVELRHLRHVLHAVRGEVRLQSEVLTCLLEKAIDGAAGGLDTTMVCDALVDCADLIEDLASEDDEQTRASQVKVAMDARSAARDVRRAFTQRPPLPMVLHCPVCTTQHVDAPDPAKGWTNPPHRSHECQACGWTWRPCDVPTTGVAAVKTAGQRDSSPERLNLRVAGAVSEQLKAWITQDRLPVRTFAKEFERPAEPPSGGES